MWPAYDLTLLSRLAGKIIEVNDLLVHQRAHPSDLAARQAHRRLQREVGDLLLGGPRHPRQFQQRLEPRLVQLQRFLRFPLPGRYPAELRQLPPEVGDLCRQLFI